MQLKKRYTLLNLLLIVANVLIVTNLSAQAHYSPFMVPDTENHEFHRHCGADEIMELKMANDPSYEEALRNLKRDIPIIVKKEQEANRSAVIINVPVVVHVIHEGEPVGTGMNISDAQIEAQIAVLNEDFNALNENFDETPAVWQGSIGNPEVNFCLAAFDPDGNATNGITRHNIVVTGTNINNSNIEDEIKPATWWDSNLYYNLWVLPIPGTTAGGGTTGYAYLPTNGAVGQDFDGSVIDFNWFGGPGFGQTGYKTLTHETGHYLGLPHTFDGDACGVDDGFADTPDIESETSSYVPNLNCSPNSFPTGPTTCGNEHMYVNYMDYVNDDYCYTSFSNEQIALMRAVLLGNTSGTGFASRAPLANNAVAVCTFFDNDAGVTEINTPSTFVCEAGQITPEVVITNFGQANLTSVTINYQINNNAPVSLVHATNLLTAETETVTLAPYTPPAGNYTFSVFTTLPNGVADEQIENDSTIISTTAVIPLPLPLLEDFENAAFNPTTNGLFIFDITGDGIVWERSTAASGFGNGSASAMFDNFSQQRPNGTIDALITPIYDFSSVSGAEVTFDVGYAIYDDGVQTLTDTLIMLVSTNCGQNFTQQIFVKGGAELATAPVHTGLFTPEAAEWRKETVDLSAFDGFDNLTVMFVNYHGYGNRLFLDNINISLPCALTATETHVDVDCFGECTGSANVNPSGGSGSYTYQWDANAGDATTQSVTGLCAGDYMVTVSEGPGCSQELTITITENSALSATVTGTNETEVGANDGTATANPTGGNNSSYTYLWNNAGNTQTITNLAPNTYTVTVTDGSGCTFEEIVVIEPYDCGTYGITVTGTNISCNGDDDGSVSASVNAGAGTAPFTYSWSNAAGNVTMISSLAPGEYFVTITDDKGCSAEGSYEVMEPDVLTVTVATTDETAAGANDGTATATPLGGTGTITYSWSNAGNMAMIDNLAPGPYTVTVTDAEGCTASASGGVNAGAVDCSGFNISIASSNNVTCNGDCDGNITLAVNSTATPFNFDWNDNDLDGTQNPTDLCPGTYMVTVTDNDGCSASLTQVITEPDVLSATIQQTAVSCFGLCDGTINVTPTGGTGPFDVDITGGSFNMLCAGTFYTLTITDNNNCVYTEMISVPGPLADDITTSQTDASCFGLCDGTISVSATNNEPYTFDWSNSGSGSTQTGLCAGTYTITVTNDNGCETVVTETVGEPEDLVLSISSTPLSGAGANDATATAMASGGTVNYEYLWQPNGEETAMIGPLAPGTYTVIVTDNNNCTQEESVVINPFDCAGFSANLTNTNNLSCFEACDGSIATAVSGGTMPITYTWSDPSLNGQANPTNLCAGDYTVTISENNACSAILTTTVTEPTLFSVAVSNTQPSGPGVNDGTATATPSGGTPNYTYLWAPTGETTAMISNLGPGSYIVTVTDQNGCTSTAFTIISGIDCSSFELEIATTDISCFDANDGSAIAMPTGGAEPYSYIWGTASIDPSIDDLGPGTYDVLVSDNNGCTIQQTFDITEPAVLDVDITGTDETAAGANDGTAMVTSTTGGTLPYTYEWCDASTGTAVMNLPPGLCGVTVTDGNGCTVSVSLVIAAGGVDCSDFAATIATTGVTCFGGSNGSANTVVIGGTMPFTYLWSNLAETNNLTNVTSGGYSVTITDVEGCMTTANGFVETADQITANINATDETTAGAMDGTATITPSGGNPPYNFNWCNGASTNPVINLPAGVCGVTITDGSGCTEEFEVVVGAGGVDCSDFAAVIETEGVTCFGGSDGSANTVVTGGTMPYTYLWSNLAETEDIGNVISDTYLVTVTDFQGCIAVAQGFVGTVDPIMSNITSTNETSSGAMDGTATATPSGGNPPYSFSWCNGASTNPVTNLPAGTCGVTITDANNCTEEFEVVIDSDTIDCSGFMISVLIEDITCNGAMDGIATVFTFGGTEPFTYLWNTTETTPTINGLSAGVYTVTVVDAIGCESILQTSMITEPSQLSYTLTTTNETTAGANDGTASAIPTGGTIPYTVTWCNGQTGFTTTGLSAGFCTVTVSDSNDCTITETFLIEEGTTDCSDFGVTLTGQPVSCFGEEDGFVNTVLNGGEAPFSYSWSNGAGNVPSINNVPANQYTVTVVDANDCEVIGTTIISQPEEIIFTTSTTLESEAGANDGTATLTVTGGAGGPYDIVWCNGQTTETATDLPGGSCSFTVTDASGCTVNGEVFIETIPSDCSGFSMDLTVETVTCFDNNDGSATTQLTGGTPPFNYNWSNGASSSSINNLVAGPYGVTVTDAVGCTLVDEEIVAQPLPVQINTLAYDGTCGSPAAALASVSGGTIPYTYSWSNGMNSEFIEDLNAGVYQVTVTDANGCTAEEVVLVQVNSAAISVETQVDDVSCFGEADGDIDVTMTGGTPPYDFLWSTGAMTEDLFNMASGNYTVLISDDAGCLFASTYEIESPVPVSVNFLTTPADNGSNGSATALGSGGTAPYTYNWDGPQTATIIGLSAGTYSVTVTDANGCTAEGSVLLGTSSTDNIDGLLDFNLFPNPTDGAFSILANFSKSENVDLVVYNVLGQKVFYQQVSGTEVDVAIDIRSGSAGTYLVELRTETGRLVRKVVKY